jgi:hypothetical protein
VLVHTNDEPRGTLVLLIVLLSCVLEWSSPEYSTLDPIIPLVMVDDLTHASPCEHRNPLRAMEQLLYSAESEVRSDAFVIVHNRGP